MDDIASFGGSMVYNEFDTLQITPIAPIHNSKYPVLTNPLILPANKKIMIIPEKGKILLSNDGTTQIYMNVSKIETSIEDHIRLFRKKDYNYIQKINDKFIK